MSSANHGRKALWISMFFAAITLCVYWLTAYHTLTWWKGSSFSAVAVCLGVDHPPGSLILTILGWIISKLPLGIGKLYALNLFAGLTTAAAIVMIQSLARGLVDDSFDRRAIQKRDNRALLLGAVIGLVVLVLAFGKTMWQHSVMFQPYVLTVLFTTFILWALLNWWREAKDEGSPRWIFLVALLFGLDFSIHRTNLILLPGVLVWILLRYPGALGRIKLWLSGIVGGLLGLSFHLLIIPIARANPPINANSPVNWSRFYDYISLKQYGGGWLVNLFPRKAPFVDVQLKAYLVYFTDNFAYFGESFGSVLVFPILLAVTGVILLVIRRWRLAVGLFVFFLLASVGEVFYFNTPGEFYWPMDRHYLSSFAVFIILAAYGAGRIALYLRDHPGFWRIPAMTLLILLLAAAPVVQFNHNYVSANSANKTFAYDYAMNVFNTVEKDAVIFVTGDNYWPFLCLQLAEGVRPDVVVMSSSLTNTTWYLHQLKQRHPMLPVSLTDNDIDKLTVQPWQDTTIAIEVQATHEAYGVHEQYMFPDTAKLNVPPNIANKYLMIQDVFLIHLLKNNRYRRPFYFNMPPEWLRPSCRPEGLVWLAVPSESMASDLRRLKENLLSNYVYSGYNDESIYIDKFSSVMASEMQMSFITLAWEQSAMFDSTAACETLKAMERFLPPERVPYSERLAPAVGQMKQATACD